jgi:DNA-binding GntR family transcriptional regulator
MADNGQNTEDVYERVRTAILDGQLAPGAVMSQVALAQDLGISRTPLREAL